MWSDNTAQRLAGLQRSLRKIHRPCPNNPACHLPLLAGNVGTPAKPLLVVLNAVPHIHAKHGLVVNWELVRDVEAGDLHRWHKTCTALDAHCTVGATPVCSAVHFNPPRCHAMVQSQAHPRPGLLLHTCSIAWRSASHEARSESTSTPSQSRMR